MAVPSSVEQLIYYLDWAELQEEIIGSTFERFTRVLAEAGFAGIPTTHNFPLAEDTTPLNAARVGEVVDLIGYDYYNRASPDTRASVAARRSGATSTPYFS